MEHHVKVRDAFRHGDVDLLDQQPLVLSDPCDERWR